MSNEVLQVTLPGMELLASGKVREVYDAGDKVVLIATDRISAFDVILAQGIPGRGRVLTKLSEFWFRKLEDVCPNHLITTNLEEMPESVRRQADILKDRTMLVRKAEIVPVECVVRGYLAGSGWKEYQRSSSVCGVELPAGLVESDRLPEAIFTPTTKANEGHDMPMTFDEVVAAVGSDTADRIRDLSLELYRTGAAFAEQRGIILADTKFEFGAVNGRLLLADEVLTPDSSRYWDKEIYEPGRAQDSFDKQVVRDYLETTDWNKTPPPPVLPNEVIAKAAGRYQEIARRLME